MKNAPRDVAWYISGFVDGEGSFNISFRKKVDYKIRWQPVLSFNVSQWDKTLLELMKHYFGCGIIKQRRDGLYSYDVTNPQVLEHIIVPFFQKYTFFSSSKRKNFELFRLAVKLMYEKRHLTEIGLKELIELRERINEGKGRKRKYTKDTILLGSPETIR